MESFKEVHHGKGPHLIDEESGECLRVAAGFMQERQNALDGCWRDSVAHKHLIQTTHTLIDPSNRPCKLSDVSFAIHVDR